MKRLEGQRAIVTGGARGLGEAICHRLAREGAAVAVADLNAAGAETVAAAIQKSWDVPSFGMGVDVTDETQVADLVRRTVAELGGLDLLVANAGIVEAHDILEHPADAWQRVIAVNLTGYFLCAREAARVMAAQRRGVILQINSKSGKKGSFHNCSYAASKFGGIGLTQSLALDMAPFGVRVNAICPGNLLDSPLWRTSLYEQYARKWGITPEEVRRKYEEQVPLGRGCTYEDVTNVVVFLASDEAAYMTGQAINVTGGQQMF
ncbi:MAG: sorbitol-6-phosphate dehydrogenase [Armatimonadetes bacterium]|nr:sorbitol-6-phosphate dehydrogenase [Armatimonadota bacterium]